MTLKFDNFVGLTLLFYRNCHVIFPDVYHRTQLRYSNMAENWFYQSSGIAKVTQINKRST